MRIIVIDKIQTRELMKTRCLQRVGGTPDLKPRPCDQKPSGFCLQTMDRDNEFNVGHSGAEFTDFLPSLPMPQPLLSAPLSL